MLLMLFENVKINVKFVFVQIVVESTGQICVWLYFCLSLSHKM